MPRNQIAFGLEIEFDAPYPERNTVERVARRLHRDGLAASPYVEGEHWAGRKPGMWSVEEAGVRIDGECVSPVLHDNDRAWAQVRQVCETVRSCGGVADRRTGGHIHFGLESAGIGRDVNALRRVARVFAHFEDLLFRLSVSGAAGKGMHRQTGSLLRPAQPIAGFDFERLKSFADWDRVLGVRDVFLRLRSDYGTLELRLPDGTLDANRWRANVRLGAALIRGAVEMSDREAGDLAPTPLGTHAARSGDGRVRGERVSGERVRGYELFAELCTRFVTSPADRSALQRIYAESAWQPAVGRGVS